MNLKIWPPESPPLSPNVRQCCFSPSLYPPLEKHHVKNILFFWRCVPACFGVVPEEPACQPPSTGYLAGKNAPRDSEISHLAKGNHLDVPNN